MRGIRYPIVSTGARAPTDDLMSIDPSSSSETTRRVARLLPASVVSCRCLMRANRKPMDRKMPRGDT